MVIFLSLWTRCRGFFETAQAIWSLLNAGDLTIYPARQGHTRSVQVVMAAGIIRADCESPYSAKTREREKRGVLVCDCMYVIANVSITINNGRRRECLYLLLLV